MIIFPHGIHVDQRRQRLGHRRRRTTPRARARRRLRRWRRRLPVRPRPASSAAAAARECRARPRATRCSSSAPTGKLLLTLGKPGGARTRLLLPAERRHHRAERQSSSSSEGHSGTPADAQVLKFDKDGKLIKTWGKWGTAPASSISRTRSRSTRKGRLFVGDRNNNRVQIFDQDGKLSTRCTSSAARAGSSSTRTTSSTSPTPSPSRCRATTRLEARHPHRQPEGRKVIAFIPDPDENADRHERRRGRRRRRRGQRLRRRSRTAGVKKYVKK